MSVYEYVWEHWCAGTTGQQYYVRKDTRGGEHVSDLGSV